MGPVKLAVGIRGRLDFGKAALLHLLTSSRVVANVLIVAGGAAAGQAVAFAFSPLLTRIYSPEAFGLQGVFLSLISILGPFVTFRYPMAIVMADDESEAARLCRISMLIAFALSLLLGLMLLAAREPIQTLMGAEALGSLIWFLPPALFCVAFQEVADNRAMRMGRFRLVGAVTVIQAFLTNLVRTIGGLIMPTAAVLMAVTAFAPSIQATLLRLGSPYMENFRESFLRVGVLKTLWKHKDFALYRAPTDVLNAASQSVPVIMLAALYSPAAAGFYTLTRSVLNLPANVIGLSVGNVLYARFAELAQAGKPLSGLLLRSTFALLTLAPVIIGLGWLAPPAFAFIFGDEWRDAGYYARWMAVWIALMIANSPSTRVAAVIGRQDAALVFNIVLLVMRSAVFLYCARTYTDAVTAVAYFSIGSSIMISISIVAFVAFTLNFDSTRESRGD